MIPLRVPGPPRLLPNPPGPARRAHLSLMMVWSSRSWSFMGSSFSCGPMAGASSSPAGTGGGAATTPLLLLLLLSGLGQPLSSLGSAKRISREPPLAVAVLVVAAVGGSSCGRGPRRWFWQGIASMRRGRAPVRAAGAGEARPPPALHWRPAPPLRPSAGAQRGGGSGTGRAGPAPALPLLRPAPPRARPGSVPALPALRAAGQLPGTA